jgi:hypothetical protein
MGDENVASDRQTVADANVRADTYFVVSTTARCWHCGTSTRLLALALPNGHEVLEERALVPDAAADVCGEHPLQEWQYSSASALLFYVEHVSEEVRDRLKGISSCFHPGYSVATLNTYWANHCEFCATLLDDHELHCEPDSAFVMSSETAAAHIDLFHIETPFEASAAGYSFEPEFFDRVRVS